jgi:Fur family peroxide stress response transcriptional regulator
MKFYEEMISRFKEMGYRITPQRLAVFTLLDGNKSHPTAEDIYCALKRTYPNLSYTTVYNILKSIVRVGGIQELVIDSKRVHYDPDTSRHHHAFCTRCGKIIDVVVQLSIPALPAPLTACFRPTDFQVNFYGICSDCEKLPSKRLV